MTRARSLRRVAALAVLAAGLALPVAVRAQVQSPGFDPRASDGGHYHEGELGEKLLIVEQNLKCDCSCGLDVHSCQFQMQCGTSPVWSQRIRRSLEAGESVEAIEASFVADFGATVLMAPPPEGFNLVGYFLPSVAILAAGALVGLVVRGGTRREELAPVRELSGDDAERLRAAMRRLDEAEGPDW